MSEKPRTRQIQIDYSWSAFFRSLAYTAVFCFGVAVVIWSLEMGILFKHALIVSFSIGWTINITFLLTGTFFNRTLGPYLSPLPPSLLGLMAGLVLAGSLVAKRPLLFFTEDYATLILGLFFSIIGFLIFATRTRLAQSHARLIAAEMETERQEKLVTLTELKLLQAQIEPHFLFNTLSNIAGLIHTQPDAAENTLVNLTRLLRSSLSRTRETATTLREELDIAQAYLEIHAIRMGARLRYVIDCHPRLAELALPPLLIQPLIENAIVHGIEQLEQGGDISIRADEETGKLVITVTDSGPGIGLAGPNRAGTGTGLKNVKERIRALYGNDGELILTDNPKGRGTLATVKIPLPRETVQMLAARQT